MEHDLEKADSFLTLDGKTLDVSKQLNEISSQLKLERSDAKPAPGATASVDTRTASGPKLFLCSERARYGAFSLVSMRFSAPDNPRLLIISRFAFAPDPLFPTRLAMAAGMH